MTRSRGGWRDWAALLVKWSTRDQLTQLTTMLQRDAQVLHTRHWRQWWLPVCVYILLLARFNALNAIYTVIVNNRTPSIFSNKSNKHRPVSIVFGRKNLRRVSNVHMCCSRIFGRPYYRSSLWYSMSSVCLSSVCLSVTFCIVAKWYILVKKCLKEWIGNQGQKVHFWGCRHISTSGFAATATATAVFALFLPYSQAIGTRW